jgi:cell division protein FtsB
MPKIKKPKKTKLDIRGMLGENFLAVVFVFISCLCALLYLVINNLLYNQTFLINDLRANEEELEQEIKELKSRSTELESIDRFMKYLDEHPELVPVTQDDVILIEDEEE